MGRLSHIALTSMHCIPQGKLVTFFEHMVATCPTVLKLDRTLLGEFLCSGMENLFHGFSAVLFDL